MSKVAVNESSLFDIADAIRIKAKSSTTYKPSEMAPAIANLPTGGFEEAPDNDVIFVDIHGRRLYSYAIEQAKALTALPALPEEDDGLEFRAWNWSLQDIINTPYKKNIVIAPYPLINDDITKLWVEITNKYINGIKLQLNSSVISKIDWGDGSIEYPSSNTPVHTFIPGKYIITISKKDGASSIPYLASYYEGNVQEDKWHTSTSHTLYRFVCGDSIANKFNINYKQSLKYQYGTIYGGQISYCGLEVFIEHPNSTNASLELDEANNVKYVSLLPNSRITTLKAKHCLALDKMLFEDNINTAGADLSYTGVKEFDLSRINRVVSLDGNSKFPQIIYVPANLLESYCNATPIEPFTFQPVGNALNAITNKKSLFNTTTHIEGSYISSESITPIITPTSSISDVVEFSNITVDSANKTFEFDMTTLTTEASPIITVSGDFNGDVVTSEFTLTIKESFPIPTYTVEDVSGASYNFVLNTNGYYESTNQKIANSAALCKVIFNNAEGADIYFDCINYAEVNYDYGIIGNPNIELALTNADDGATGSTKVFKNFKGLSKADVQTVMYAASSNSFFMYVKFRKDGTGDSYNDSLQFKVRFK